MSEVLALIAHDLKNALGGLEAELGLLSQRPTAPAALQAHRHCQDLRQQFVEFLTLYGAEQGQLRALCEDESPTALLGNLQRRWQARLQHAGSAVHITVATTPDSPSYWYLDPRLVNMALDAAIHNASRFARSRITLSAQQARDEAGQAWLKFLVDDDGLGLGAADAQGPSTGLGSALCQAIARAHVLGERCGTSGVAPLWPAQADQGTRFTLCLP
jgi:signal transduction histidine kinase